MDIGERSRNTKRLMHKFNAVYARAMMARNFASRVLITGGIEGASSGFASISCQEHAPRIIIVSPWEKINNANLAFYMDHNGSCRDRTSGEHA